MLKNFVDTVKPESGKEGEAKDPKEQEAIEDMMKKMKEDPAQFNKMMSKMLGINLDELNAQQEMAKNMELAEQYQRDGIPYFPNINKLRRENQKAVNYHY
jgi:hypothetical protein